jgi:tRNA(fMet)-specific endonuclease VapC
MEESKILDTSALIEGLRGLTTIFSMVEFPKALKECEAILPNTKDYETAIEISRYLYQKRTPIQGMDLLIASIALNRNLTLVTKDKHSERIPNLRLEILK